MPYTQNWGISRNALQSPLNNNGDKLIPYWDAENRKWYNVGDEGHDGRTEADHKKRIEQIKSDIYDKPVDEIGKEPEKKWTKDPKNWETWPVSERPSGWSLTGSKNPDGTDSDNAFTEYELDSASKISENKKSQAMLKGGEEWENSEYNTQPKKGYDHQGNPMTLHEGDKVTFDGKDITESYNRKLSGKLSVEDQMDNAQAALGVGGFHPMFGWAADSANALLSGGRGVASLFGVGEKSAQHHFGKGFSSLTYAAPGFGDIKALDKINKYSKAFNNFTRGKGSNYLSGGVDMFKPNSKTRDFVRGAASWAFGKNKDTKLGNTIKNMFGKNVGGTMAAATSSKGIVKGQEAVDTLSNVASASSESIAPLTKPIVSSIKANLTPFVGPIASTVEKAPPAHSIIQENNLESSSKT